jgi:hypothetical protein
LFQRWNNFERITGKKLWGADLKTISSIKNFELEITILHLNNWKEVGRTSKTDCKIAPTESSLSWKFERLKDARSQKLVASSGEGGSTGTSNRDRTWSLLPRSFTNYPSHQSLDSAEVSGFWRLGPLSKHL